MREELDKLLCEKYPKIFRDRNAPMSETCMCWGFECGDGWFNIIDALCEMMQEHVDRRILHNERAAEYEKMREAAKNGDWTLFDKEYSDWYQEEKYADFLIEKKHKLINEEIPDYMKAKPEIPQVIAVQVKEKFGTLRFYFDGGDHICHAYVAMAEAMSARTCEMCGKSGVLRQDRGWIQTLCDEHA